MPSRGDFPSASVKEIHAGIWIVRLMHHDLGYVALEQKTLQCLDNRSARDHAFPVFQRFFTSSECPTPFGPTTACRSQVRSPWG